MCDEKLVGKMGNCCDFHGVKFEVGSPILSEIVMLAFSLHLRWLGPTSCHLNLHQNTIESLTGVFY